ncbi:hypothetical protein [Lacrimispora xylanisolvens]|uniref:hypothetical protein n=1 Tax=Lacrimispora xylanisolvens TaxID=384636 RepID=UPI003D9C8ECC
MYAADKNQNNYSEVTPGKIYTTDQNGIITVGNLDITKDYYWSESGSADRLEADETGKNIDDAIVNGIKTPLIGPYTVSRSQILM